jgi:PAS domain S-box-containing protein
MRVLIVDDKEDNLYYLSALLSGHGYSVDTARDGAEALEKAREAPPAIVVSDLLMPVMDGFTLLRHWKADVRLRKAPFIVYTATYTEPSDEQLARNLGADAFILKPAEPALFLARILEVQAQTEAAVPVYTEQTSGEEASHLREYSETLIRKLEQKTLQLEASNKELRNDIATRARVELALRDSEERFRQLAENIDAVFWLSDPERHVIFYISPAYASIFGRTCESLYACPGTWDDCVHRDDREQVTRSLAGQVIGNWDETYRIVRPDGAIRWVRARAYPVRGADGQVCRIAGVLRDVTEYRRLQEQFRQAQKMEAVGRLAGGVAHDFNNMLSVILSYTSLVLDELKPGTPMRDDIEEAHRAAQRGAALTGQLLAFSRQQMLQPKVLDLSRVVRDMEKMLARLLGEDVELTLVTPSVGCRVHADPSQLEQIVMNLAINARDAMPDGGNLAIEISNVELDTADADSRPGVLPGPYVMLTMTDTGSGMDEATQERVFEPFFTTKEEGTGLGLSTVFGIVKQSHGHIHIDSEPGVGASFKVYLPRTQRPIETLAAATNFPVAMRGTETILLVEDDAQVRDMCCAILRRNGYNVLPAQDGQEALLLHERSGTEIHLLLTDVVMPRMNGPELAERLTQKAPALKVLYVSGYAESAIIHHGVLEKGITFMAKPVTPAVLLKSVREVLAPSGAREIQAWAQSVDLVPK